MAALQMIPAVGLSPLEAADLAQPRRIISSNASRCGHWLTAGTFSGDLHGRRARHRTWLDVLRQAGYAATGVFTDITIEESIRRTTDSHRAGSGQLPPRPRPRWPVHPGPSHPRARRHRPLPLY